MKSSKRQITVNSPAQSHPKTVQELIDNLALYPMDYEISFSPFTLYRTKDRGGVVHFEMNEVQGHDYDMFPENKD
jgi:hypothetical protein